MDKSKTTKAFVKKALVSELQARGLMVESKKDGAVAAIEEILTNFWFNLATSIEHFSKNIVKKRVVTREIVQSGFKMM